MTIKDLSDAIVEKYRPYSLSQTSYDDPEYDKDVCTRNAVLCGIKEVEARIDDFMKITSHMPLIDSERIHIRDLTAILNELKSRI